MGTNTVNNIPKILTFLKQEEKFYKNLLHHMEQQSVRLEIEELILKSEIRREQMKLDLSFKTENQSSPAPSQSSDVLSPFNDASSTGYSRNNSCNDSLNTQSSEFEQSYSRIRSSMLDDSVQSNITDDRYLDPLILDSSIVNDNQLIEFDD